MTLLPKVRNSLRNQSVIHFEIDHPDDETFDGVVIYMTSNFIAVCLAIDFELSGIAIVPRTHLKSVRDNANEKSMTRIMRHNRQLDKLKVPRWLSTCETLPDIFCQLKNRSIWPAVTIVDGKDSWFFIGKITLAEERGFCIESYTSTGKWTKEQGLRMQDVALINVDGQYEKHFNRYMKDCLKQ